MNSLHLLLVTLIPLAAECHTSTNGAKAHSLDLEKSAEERLVKFTLVDETGVDIFTRPVRRLDLTGVPHTGSCSSPPESLHLTFETAGGATADIYCYLAEGSCDEEAFLRTEDGAFPLDCGTTYLCGDNKNAVVTLSCVNGVWSAGALVRDDADGTYTDILYEDGGAYATKPTGHISGCDTGRTRGLDGDDSAGGGLRRVLHDSDSNDDDDAEVRAEEASIARMLNHAYTPKRTGLWQLSGAPCAGDNKKRSLLMGFTIGPALKKKIGVNGASNYVRGIVDKSNLMYEDQFAVKLVVGEIFMDSTPCVDDTDADLTRLTNWVQKNRANAREGLWHSFDVCSGGAIAWVGSICSKSNGHNTGTTYDKGQFTWEWFAHEVGHNFNANHPKNVADLGYDIPDEQAGIMDYGTAKFEGFTQFNPGKDKNGNFRKTTVCTHIRAKKSCNAFKVIGTIGQPPTPPPSNNNCQVWCPDHPASDGAKCGWDSKACSKCDFCDNTPPSASTCKEAMDDYGWKCNGSGCMAVINSFGKYRTCGNYCSEMGLRCEGAWKSNLQKACKVRRQKTCSTDLFSGKWGTSKGRRRAICQCSNPAASKEEVPATSALESWNEAPDFNKWAAMTAEDEAEGQEGEEGTTYTYYNDVDGYDESDGVDPNGAAALSTAVVVGIAGAAVAWTSVVTA